MKSGAINFKKQQLQSLKVKHRELDDEVIMLYNKHISDDVIKPLKQEKLYLKQQIMNLEEQINKQVE
tara:strand:- start:70 stop:270 length:201 start_codon:yes stop_codon:yes gene_type:complete